MRILTLLTYKDDKLSNSYATNLKSFGGFYPTMFDDNQGYKLDWAGHIQRLQHHCNIYLLASLL